MKLKIKAESNNQAYINEIKKSTLEVFKQYYNLLKDQKGNDISEREIRNTISDNGLFEKKAYEWNFGGATVEVYTKIDKTNPNPKISLRIKANYKGMMNLHKDIESKIKENPCNPTLSIKNMFTYKTILN